MQSKLTEADSPLRMDQFDYEMIRHFKQCPISLDVLLEIWGRRCAVTPDRHHTVYIAKHLLHLAARLDLMSCVQMVENLDPNKDWMFGMKRDKDNYWENVLAVIGSVFMLADVDLLPGYRRWVELRDSINDKKENENTST